MNGIIIGGVRGPGPDVLRRRADQLRRLPEGLGQDLLPPGPSPPPYIIIIIIIIIVENGLTQAITDDDGSSSWTRTSREFTLLFHA